MEHLQSGEPFSSDPYFSTYDYDCFSPLIHRFLNTGLCFLEPECNTVCNTVNEQQCRTENRQQCSTVNEQQCSIEQREQCSNVPEERCQVVNEQQCKTVNRQQCKQVQLIIYSTYEMLKGNSFLN